MNIGKIVNDVEIIRLDELTDEDAPVDSDPVMEQPPTATAR